MKKIHRERLLKVATALRDAAKDKRLRDKFTMDTYGYKAEEGDKCGTPACALGHFAARRDLQRTFVLRIDGDVDVPTVSFQPFAVFHTINEYFGLEEHENRELFERQGCGGAKTPIQAARYIEKFVAKRTPA